LYFFVVGGGSGADYAFSSSGMRQAALMQVLFCISFPKLLDRRRGPRIFILGDEKPPPGSSHAAFVLQEPVWSARGRLQRPPSGLFFLDVNTALGSFGISSRAD
jgi:hypothetical protein